jgi:hypothetical protein
MQAQIIFYNAYYILKQNEIFIFKFLKHIIQIIYTVYYYIIMVAIDYFIKKLYMLPYNIINLSCLFI